MSSPEIPIPYINIDLDGVMFDFYGETTRILGVPYKSLPSAEAWGRLEKVDSLFRNLPLLPDALELWQGIQGAGHLRILTAMPKPTGKLLTAAGDKVASVRQHICHQVPVVVVEHGLMKARWARPGDVLIDDLERNIIAWEAAGGIGILHRSARDSLQQLARIRDTAGLSA